MYAKFKGTDTESYIFLLNCECCEFVWPKQNSLFHNAKSKNKLIKNYVTSGVLSVGGKSLRWVQ